MTLEVVLWIAVVVLALWAGWLTLPRSMALDWERLFKLALVTGIRGPIEARDGGVDEWLRAGRERVWYHPAARSLVAKLRDPAAFVVPVPTLSGERALMEKLSSLEDPSARLVEVFEQGGDEPLYEDPAGFGPDWDLARILGPGAGWEEVATWSDSVVEVLRRRAEHHKWAIVGHPILARSLAQVLGERVVEVDDLEELSGLVPRMSDRVVIVTLGATGLFEHLHEAPALRDQVAAVVGIDLENDPAWLAEHFDNEAFDTEVNRATPYFHLAFVERDPDLDRLEASLLPVPQVPDTMRVVLEPIDLGVLPGPVADCPPDLLARALLIVVSARLALA
ncbi:MAG TPA: hypothetical protein QGF58_19420 [Myxococcota bacterium]|nr:hypothetical protein [Myxococcota bacterium]